MSGNDKLKCAIVDDELHVRARLESLLRKQPELEIVLSEGDPEKASTEIPIHKPDIVFIDVEMTVINGFELIERVRSTGLNPTFIFVTAFNQYAIKAIKNAAFDFLLKPVDIDELCETLNRYRKELCSGRSDIRLNPQFNSLSDREKDVLEFLLKGCDSKEIAEKLFISKHTVDTHRRHILEKLEVRNTVELITRFD